jgi:hypothetical protein
MRSVLGPAVAGSDGQALAALGAACVDDGAAASGLHANEEAVGARAPHFGGLVGAFHVLVTGLISGEPAIIAEKPNGGNDIADVMQGFTQECDQVRGGKEALVKRINAASSSPNRLCG